MFDFSDIKDEEGHKQFNQEKRKTVSTLHAILRPFLLRRLKTDVETLLPKKREYILYAPLTPVQKELYRKIKDGDVRAYLEGKVLERLSADKSKSLKFAVPKGVKRKLKGNSEDSDSRRKIKFFFSPVTASHTRPGRKGIKPQSYTEVNDDEYFKGVEESSESEEVDQEEAEAQERTMRLSLASKAIYQL